MAKSVRNENRIIIFDTTLRDGEQTPGVNLNLHEKLEIARQLEKLGVDVIEAGFPAASVGDFESVSAIAGTLQHSSVAALCRASAADIKRGYDAIKHAAHPRIHTFIATSPIHMHYKLRMEPSEVLSRAIDAVAFARELCADVEFSAEDASRSDREFLYRIIEAVVKAGATTVNIPDTVGYASPEEYGQLFRDIQKNVPHLGGIVLSTHCHDDLGMATANSLAAIRNGARQIECTINGLGERAGNAALEEIVMALSTRADLYGFSHGIETTGITRTSRMVSSYAGIDIPPNKSVVGNNAFRHESGIHQHGMLRERSTYEIMTPESVGLVKSGMVLGKLSGRHAFVERLRELGYVLTDVEIDEAFTKFKQLADRKKDVTDRDIEALIGHEVDEVPDMYELESFQLQSGNKIKSIASVTLTYKGNEISEAAVGDGPIDAAFNAVDRAVGCCVTLDAYGIKAVTEGKDALGEVTVRVSVNGRTYTGKGLSTDIIESSVRAYINAVNRAVSEISYSKGEAG